MHAQRPRIGRLLCAVAGLAGLSGCALWTPPTQSEVLAQALPPGTRVPPAWASATDPGVVTDDWLATFRDPGLDAVVAEGIAHNLDLRQAAAKVEAARQSVIVVGSKLLPQIGAQIGTSNIVASQFGGTNQKDSYHSSSEYVGVYWELDVWGRLRAQRASADAGFQATALDYAFARQSLAATVAKSWYATIAARQRVALAEQSVQIYRQLLDLVQVRRQAGKVADLDVAEAQANLSTAEGTLRSAQAQYSEARRMLELLLGRYPAAAVAVAPRFAPLPPPIPAGIPGAVLARRPDVVAAERQVLAQFRQVEAAQLALWPSFSFVLDGGHLADRALALLQLNPWLLHTLIGMTIPIYSGGALTAQVAIATAEQEQAVARYATMVLRACFEVEVALTNEGLLLQRLRLEEQGLTDRSEAVRIARVKYTAGAIDFLSVLQLQERELSSEALLIELRAAVLANRINLHLALGGSFETAPAVEDASGREVSSASGP